MTIPIFLINLIDRPERLNNSLKELNKVGLVNEIIRINATDKNTAKKLKHKLFDYRIEGNINNIKSTKIIPTWGAAACAISHLKVWEFIKNKNIEYALILEDDNEIYDTEKFLYNFNLALSIYNKFKRKNNFQEYKNFFLSLCSHTNSHNNYNYDNLDIIDFNYEFTGLSCYFVNNNFCNFMLENINEKSLLYQIDLEIGYRLKNIYNKNISETFILNNSGIKQSNKYNSDAQFYFISLITLKNYLIKYLPLEMIEKIKEKNIPIISNLVNNQEGISSDAYLLLIGFVIKDLLI